jgi:hypothetical protein
MILAWLLACKSVPDDSGGGLTPPDDSGVPVIETGYLDPTKMAATADPDDGLVWLVGFAGAAIDVTLVHVAESEDVPDAGGAFLLSFQAELGTEISIEVEGPVGTGVEPFTLPASLEPLEKVDGAPLLRDGRKGHAAISPPLGPPMGAFVVQTGTSALWTDEAIPFEILAERGDTVCVFKPDQTYSLCETF